MSKLRYTEWSSWSDCHNQDFKVRTRTCLDEEKCEKTREVDYCEPDHEEVLGMWVNQGSCQVGSTGCGSGEQMKVRQCWLDRPRYLPGTNRSFSNNSCNSGSLVFIESKYKSCCWFHSQFPIKYYFF